MSGSDGIKAYAELCFIADRETDAAEFMAMVMFGIKPDWLIELENA